MTIRKLRAGRVPNVTADTWVGEIGTLFYDEATGQFKIADGVTPGGHYVNLVVATTSQLGGIKAGPGANVSNDGTLTIDTAGLPLSFGDFSAIGGNLSVVNSNENMNLITNGSGNVNIIGNLQLFSTGSGYVYPTNPIFNILNNGNVNINGNLITNGNTTAIGTYTFIGPVTHYGNLTINGNTTNNGSTINNGLLTQNGNLRATGQSTHIVANISTTATAGFLITGNAQGLYQAPVNTGVGLHISGADDGNTVSRFYVDSIGQYAVIAGRRFNGNINTPTQVLANQDIVRYAGTPYTSGGWPTIGPARVTVTANEDQTASNQGGRLEFWATPNGTVASTNIQRIATVDAAVGITSNIGITAVGNVNAGNVNATTVIATTGTFTNINNSIAAVNANVVAANTNISTLFTNASIQQTQINSLASGANANTAAFLTTYSGNITANNIVLTNNVNANIGTIGNLVINNNNISSLLPAVDLTIGTLSASANLVINCTTVHNKDVYVNGNVTAPTYNISNSGIRNLGPNTSPVINFATDSLVFVYNPGGTVTFSFANYVAGARVKALVALTANRTINFGVANAMHSTSGATSVTFGGFGNPTAPETVSLEYICVDGTLANTYVIANYL